MKPSQKGLKLQLLLWIVLLFSMNLYSQKIGGLAGKVFDADQNKGIAEVIVKIVELDKSVFSDDKGYFEFKNIAVAEYTLTFQAPGYGRTILLSVPVLKNLVMYREVFLQKDEDEGEKFYIGGIEVTAQRELLPDKASTTTKISSGEIEHIQAASLGDVMELIPGQRFENPGLGDVKQVRIRQAGGEEDDAARNAAMGTQIVLDGVPVSNNANMLLDSKLNTSTDYRVTVNSGVDLREIPAENIESVEVIRGIPPARYGDLTSGAVLVETAIGHVPYRAKYKYNPKNKELNTTGGYGWENFKLNYNINYAHSLRNIRVPGDAYTRVAAQLNLENKFLDQKLNVTNRFYYTRVFDEQDVREGDLFETERWRRGYTMRWNARGLYKWNEQRKFEGIFSVNLNRQNSFYKSIISRDISIISDLTEPGTQAGYFVSDYTTELRVKSRAWNFYGRLEYESQFKNLGLLHVYQAGIDLRHEFNNGPGRIFDPRYPPNLTDNGGDRPRSYNDLPGLTLGTLYFQDEIVGHIWRDFNLQLGLRYDLLDPYKFDFSNLGDGKSPVESNFGNFFSPRINFVQYFAKNTQIRMGYGHTAKAPPLSMIYPNPQYFDVVDSMYYDPDSLDKNLAIVTTYIEDRTNKKLKAFTQDKYEASIDQRIGNFGLSFTWFYERMRNGFELGGYHPVSFTQYTYPEWPQTAHRIPRDTLLLSYNTAINSVESISRGIEFSLTSKKFKSINTAIRVDAAYRFTKSWWQDNHYEYSSLRKDPNLNERVRAYWHKTTRWSDELIIHYRFDTMVKSLGLWFTLAIQQVAMDRDKLIGLEDSLALGYIRETGENVVIPEDERGNEKYSAMRRTYADYNYITESRPNLWLVNLTVSKSLWKGAEASFFVKNVMNYRPLYQRDRVPEGSVSYIRRNPEIFYGLQVSMVVDDFVRFLKKNN